MSTQQPSKHSMTGVVIAEEISNAPSIAVEGAEHTDGLKKSDEPLHPYHVEFAGFHEDYVRHYISLADQKAGWAFAVTSSVLAYLLVHEKTLPILLKPELDAQFSLLFASSLLLGLSSSFTFWVIAPRLWVRSGEGVVFFNDVAARRDAADYVNELSKLSELDIARARLKHSYDTSKVCAAKYANLGKGILLGLVGLSNAILALSLL